MSERPADELPSDVIALLSLERQASSPPGDARGRVARRLGLAGPPMVPAASPPRPPWWWSAAFRTSVLAIAGAAGAGTWFATRPRDVPVTAPLAQPRPAPAVPVVPVPPERVPPERALPAHPPPQPARAETEVALLGRARQALADEDPRRALALLRRHERAWPDGELVQEREVLTIQALARTGASEAARARAARFLARFPGSTLADTVGQLMQQRAGD
jgi:hypothetical protein